MLRRVLLILAAAALLSPGTAAAAARTSIFYYPWYGTPQVDGGFMHWQQNGAAPPFRIASAYYPARGAYSSADRLVLDAQMDELDRTGVDQISVSLPRGRLTALVGPNALKPAALRSSTIPAAIAASGPTTTKSTAFFLQKSITAG